YDYIAIDGWGTGTYNEYGYRIKHDYRWQYTYREWSEMLRDRGMKLAMYDNPLWVNKAAADGGVKIRGTDYYLRDIVDWDTPNLWFYWVEVDRPGAEEYIKGNIRHWAEMGVDYLKMDFFSWYEDGYDKSFGVVGRTDRPRKHYETALRWIREEADKQGVFLSLAMANCKNNAELEAKYCHMIRISDDIWAGDWAKFATNDRNKPRTHNGQPLFPLYTNMFDGFIYYSSLSGPGKVFLDGDYGWLNTNYWTPTKNDNKKRTIITLHVVAGGIVSLTDQYNTAGTDLRYYQNRKLLELVHEGFIARPLSSSTETDDATVEKSHVWWGQAKNGDYVAAFFNREGSQKTRSISFSQDMGITVDAANPVYVTELWDMKPPAGSTITDVDGTLTDDVFTINNLPGDDCRIFRISRP
ncbi:MAG: hypothetical protein LBF78_15045, partial [Treponema sp.]|nr:hypothetical protein [Treponema sp.]